MYDVIIIGMGIGGITAGIYGKRAGLNVLMFEKVLLEECFRKLIRFKIIQVFLK